MLVDPTPTCTRPHLGGAIAEKPSPSKFSTGLTIVSWLTRKLLSVCHILLWPYVAALAKCYRRDDLSALYHFGLPGAGCLATHSTHSV